MKDIGPRVSLKNGYLSSTSKEINIPTSREKQNIAAKPSCGMSRTFPGYWC